MIERRDFIKAGAATIAASALPAFGFGGREELRGALYHWGVNQWGEALPDRVTEIKNGHLANKKVTFVDQAWEKMLNAHIAKKMNFIVIDLGEFPKYPSHPELAVEGSREPEWILEEVKKMKRAGLTVIPKLNFSAGHDAWLKEYSRMLTTMPYYRVCRDVIKDVYEMFDHPEYMHIGYDEESEGHQKGFICVRRDEVWWHDFLFFVKSIEKLGMRPWMWSDYGWYHPEFVDKCPKSVVQQNWYYDETLDGFDIDKMAPNCACRKYLGLFEKLDKAGFDQVPCSSTWVSPQRKAAGVTSNDESMAKLVKFCREKIAGEKLRGFMMAAWGAGTTMGAVGEFTRALDILNNALKV